MKIALLALIAKLCRNKYVVSWDVFSVSLLDMRIKNNQN